MIVLVNNPSFNDLKKSYDNLTVRKAFYPEILKKVLKEKSEISFDDAWDVCEFFLKKSNFLQRNAFSSTRRFCNSTLFIAFKMLQAEGLAEGGACNPYFRSIANHPHPDKLVQAYSALQKAKISDMLVINQALLSKHPMPHAFVPLLCLLSELGLLKPEMIEYNCQLLVEQKNPQILCYILKKYQKAGLLQNNKAQEFFDELIRYSSILIGDQDTCNIWKGLSPNKLTTEKHCEWIRLIAEHVDEPAQGRAVFLNIMNDIIFMTLPMNMTLENNELNREQSTHTASVHATVSESALKLWRRYGSLFSENAFLASVFSVPDENSNRQFKVAKDCFQYLKNPDELMNIKSSIMASLSTWLNNFHDERDEHKLAAAKRCFQRLSTINAFSDPKSAISLTTLLALIWLAIHDDEHREGTIDDAKRLLIEAFYEIQRGYNITEEGDDDGLDDSYICLAGTFNKVLEKFWAVHTDIELIYMTKKGASMKLIAVINDAVMSYVNKLTNPSPEVLKKLTTMMMTQTIKPLYKDIKAVVAERMFDEFGALWEHNQASDEFIAFINSGKYAPLRASAQKAIEQCLERRNQNFPNRDGDKKITLFQNYSIKGSPHTLLQPQKAEILDEFVPQGVIGTPST